MFSRLAACTVAVLLAMPVHARPADQLLDSLKIQEIVEIMREEGRDYAAGMARDLLPSGETRAWREAVDRIYSPEAMEEVVREGFLASFGDADAEPLLEFFATDEGKEVVSLEVEARREMISPEVEAAAREAWREREGGDDPRLAQLDRFVEANDLVEANVVGALNASFQFYLGLVDGGGMEMTEPEIVTEVWMQEEATRLETREWLYGYMLTAYQPLPDAALDRYIDVSATPEGKAMNRALFAGFNHMYEEISYGLGLAAAREMHAQEL